MEAKKRLAQKKPSSFKSEAKQVIQNEPGKSGSKKRVRIEDLYNDDEAKFSVMERAEVVLASIADEVPKFHKCMLPSNVSHGFWMIFPKKFCNLHLPMHDTTVILVDECEQEYEANYLANRHGLSGGWRGFSLAHRLLKGDIVVFHLIRPCTLKVQIVRVYGLDVVDGAFSLMNLAAPVKEISSDKCNRTRKKSKKCAEALQLESPRKNVEKDSTTVSYLNHGLLSYHSEANSDGIGSSDVLRGSKISDHRAIEPGCSQIPILQDHLLEGVNCRLTTGKVF